MGSILVAECECGFKSEEMFAGGGMLNFYEVCNAPAICKECGIIFTRNFMSTKKNIRCPNCKKKALYYNDPILHGDKQGEEVVFSWNLPADESFILPHTTYCCPQCRQMNLRFFDVGCWD